MESYQLLKANSIVDTIYEGVCRWISKIRWGLTNYVTSLFYSSQLEVDWDRNIYLENNIGPLSWWVVKENIYEFHSFLIIFLK